MLPKILLLLLSSDCLEILKLFLGILIYFLFTFFASISVLYILFEYSSGIVN